MPKKGHQYPIDSGWKDRVRSRLAEMNITQNELARRANISKASLSEALAVGALQSAYVPEIHRALRWAAPQLVLSPDKLELLALYDQMEDRDQGGLVERARAKVEEARAKPRRSH